MEAGTLIGLAVLLGLALIFCLIAFWIWMIVDCAQRNFKKSEDKIIWILIIVFAQAIGAFIYYLIVKRKDKR